MRAQMINAVTLVALLATTGCQQSERGSVYGQVLQHDGTPLAGARVIARTDGGASPYGLTNAEGRFQLGVVEQGDGVPAGTYRVAILEDRGEYGARTPATIPDRYEDPTQSGLNFSIAAGDRHEFNVQLEPR